MRVVVIGAAGMLGRDMAAAFGRRHEVASADRNEVDIADASSVRALLEGRRPEAVVNCAAFTRVDAAEAEPNEAYSVNAWGAWNLAAACKEHGAALCQISTDYVFDGTADRPYTEFDNPNPLNVYGASKLAGEQAVQWSGCKWWIVRTQWLYGTNGRNFTKAILRKAAAGEPFDVVNDQRGAPTWTRDLAEKTLEIVEECPPGIYHANNSGECSWFELARALLKKSGGDPELVRPARTVEKPGVAPRPRRSTLRRLSLELQGRDDMRPWQDALADYTSSI
jgi:dTDP-4-dehydrorhamnose reductase